MQLNIPDIGAELILTEAWSFKLILENRNNKLTWHFFPDYDCDQYSYNNSGFNTELGLAQHTSVLHSLKFKALRDEIYNECNKNNTWNRDKYAVRVVELYKQHLDEWITEDNIPPIKFPKDTYLKVDRIYIRKGKGMSDFSSVSFWAQFPGIKKKFRFFAKLNDVNNIKYINK